MLLALLLLAHARADWVEITQVPRRPVRTQLTTKSHLTLQTRRDPINFSTERTRASGNNRIYINHSLEHRSKGIVHRVPNISNAKRIRVTTEEPARTKYEETELSEPSRGYSKRNPFKMFEERIPEFVTKEESFDDYEEELHFSRKPEETWTERHEIKIKDDGSHNIPVRKMDGDKTESVITSKDATSKDHIRNKGQNLERPIENDTKVKTMENMLKFVKVVTDTITKNTRRSFSSKVRYLEDLRDTIIVNIEDRVEALFPEDAGAARRRRAARGHVEFPSSEGALMTISFLTFAVYLIKLVLQVVQSYKNKMMTMTPAVIAAVGRKATQKEN